MSRGKRLTKEQRKEIYEARMQGWSRAEVARAYGIAEHSVTEVVKKHLTDMEKENEDMAHREHVVAGDKRNGRLTTTTDPHRFEGTCVVAGKANSKVFVVENTAAAKEQWLAWCDELRTKRQKPESRPKGESVVQKEATVVQKEEPVAQEEKLVVRKEEPVMDNNLDRVYVIWAKGDSPKLFGAYGNEDEALEEVVRLNEIASFLMDSHVFEVEEVSYRS